MIKLITAFMLSMACVSIAIAQQQPQQQDDCGTKVTQFLKVDYAKLQQNKSIFSTPYQLRMFIHIVADDNGGRLAVTNNTAFLQYLEGTRAFYASHNICFSLVAIDTIYSTTLNDMVIDNATDLNTLTGKLIPGCVNVFFHNSLSDGGGGTYNGNAYGIPNYYCSILGSLIGTTNTSTLTHEMGHDYGLYHTFETANGVEYVPRNGGNSNCTTTGDLLCGTTADPNPPSSQISAACVYTGNAQDPLGNNYNPPVTNFMTYGRFACRSTFTQDQDDRMAFFITNSSNLVNALNDDNLTVTANFAAASGTLVRAARNTVIIAPTASTTTSYIVGGSCKGHFTAKNFIDFKPGTQFVPSSVAGLTEAHINTMCQ